MRTSATNRVTRSNATRVTRSGKSKLQLVTTLPMNMAPAPATMALGHPRHITGT